MGKEPIPVPEWTVSLKVTVDGTKETGRFQKMYSKICIQTSSSLRQAPDYLWSVIWWEGRTPYHWTPRLFFWAASGRIFATELYLCFPKAMSGLQAEPTITSPTAQKKWAGLGVRLWTDMILICSFCRSGRLCYSPMVCGIHYRLDLLLCQEL